VASGSILPCQNFFQTPENPRVHIKTAQGGHKPGKPGMLRDFFEHGKLREFSGNSVQPQEKIVTNKWSFTYLCKTAVDWVNRIIRNRDEVIVW